MLINNYYLRVSKLIWNNNCPEYNIKSLYKNIKTYKHIGKIYKK